MTEIESAFRRPESVLVVVHTRAHDCLLLERVEPRGFWQSVTGTLRWGESPAEAASRELREETGLAPDGVGAAEGLLRDARVTRSFPILPAWRDRYAPDVEENVEHLWYLELGRQAPIVIDSNEHTRYLWLPLDAAVEKASSWTNREALERLRPGAGETP